MQVKGRVGFSDMILSAIRGKLFSRSTSKTSLWIKNQHHEVGNTILAVSRGVEASMNLIIKVTTDAPPPQWSCTSCPTYYGALGCSVLYQQQGASFPHWRSHCWQPTMGLSSLEITGLVPCCYRKPRSLKLFSIPALCLHVHTLPEDKPGTLNDELKHYAHDTTHY